MKMHWIVVADASRARVLAADALLEEFDAVASLIHPESQFKASRWVSDDRGRCKGAAGIAQGAQSAFEPHTDLKDQEAAVFAREVAGVLRDGLVEGAYERLVLVAAPAFLGELRAAMDTEVARCVVATVNRNLTKLPLHELPEAVRGRIHDTAGLP